MVYGRIVSRSNKKRPLKKRCRIIPAGGLGVSPSFIKVPQDWGIRGLIKTISVISENMIKEKGDN